MTIDDLNYIMFQAQMCVIQFKEVASDVNFQVAKELDRIRISILVSGDDIRTNKCSICFNIFPDLHTEETVKDLFNYAGSTDNSIISFGDCVKRIQLILTYLKDDDFKLKDIIKYPVTTMYYNSIKVIYNMQASKYFISNDKINEESEPIEISKELNKDELIGVLEEYDKVYTKIDRMKRLLTKKIQNKLLDFQKSYEVE